MRMSVIDGTDRNLLFRVQEVHVMPRIGDTMKWKAESYAVTAVEFSYEAVDEFRPLGELQRIDVIVAPVI
jgi:hypothetical protein